MSNAQLGQLSTSQFSLILMIMFYHTVKSSQVQSSTVDGGFQAVTKPMFLKISGNFQKFPGNLQPYQSKEIK